MGNLDDTGLQDKVTSMIKAFRSRKERAFVSTAKTQTHQTAFPMLALSNLFLRHQVHILEI
jgi:hypothetical protein